MADGGTAWWTCTRFRLLDFKDRQADDKRHGNETEPAPIRDGGRTGPVERQGGGVCESASSAVVYTTCFHSLAF